MKVVDLPAGEREPYAMRYHGAKWRIAPWVIEHFPRHRIYVEAFGGAAGVLLRKQRSYAEVWNDLDGEVVNFFRVLRDPESRARLVEAIELTPFARAEFEAAYEPATEPIERARRTAVRAQMGFGSAGATKYVTGFRSDMKRAHGTAAHDWQRYPEAVRRAGERFAGVLIENKTALEVMRDHDTPDTLHYCDPPYVHDTRSKRNAQPRATYRHEMTDEQHVELLEGVKRLQGLVIVSGYRSGLYDELLRGWERRETVARISGGRGGLCGLNACGCRRRASM